MFACIYLSMIPAGLLCQFTSRAMLFKPCVELTMLCNASLRFAAVLAVRERDYKNDSTTCKLLLPVSHNMMISLLSSFDL